VVGFLKWFKFFKLALFNNYQFPKSTTLGNWYSVFFSSILVRLLRGLLFEKVFYKKFLKQSLQFAFAVILMQNK